MKTHYHKGERIRLSELGKTEAYPASPYRGGCHGKATNWATRQGSVKHKNSGPSVAVTWDGNKYSSSIHHTYIEPVE